MIADLVSVIIPVYNTDKYVSRCLDSVIKQSYSKIEIIVVDDGSTDNSLKICEEYCEIDKRIRIIQKNNGGLSSARNAALDAINGEFVSFIDSDDIVSLDYISSLLGLIKKYDADVSVCDENRFIEKNGERIYLGSPYKKVNKILCQTPEEGLYSYITQTLYDASACMKLYKSCLFANVRYPVGYNHEDIGTTYKIYCKSKRIVFTPSQMYFYFQRQDSIIHENKSIKLKKNLQDGIKMTEMQRDDVVACYPALRIATECRCFSMYCRAVGLSKFFKDDCFVDYCWNNIKIMRKKFLLGKFRNKVKVAALLSYFGKKSFVLFYSLMR